MQYLSADGERADLSVASPRPSDHRKDSSKQKEGSLFVFPNLFGITGLGDGTLLYINFSSFTKEKTRKIDIDGATGGRRMPPPILLSKAVLTVVRISELEPKMVVKIVDRWNKKSSPNLSGLMDGYLGQFVTISDVFIGDRYFFIEEDNRSVVDCSSNYKWAFDEYMVDYIADDGKETMEQTKPISELFS